MSSRTMITSASLETIPANNADTWPDAVSVLKLAQDHLLDNNAVPAEMAQPVYLRDNVAQKSRPQVQGRV